MKIAFLQPPVGTMRLVELLGPWCPYHEQSLLTKQCPEYTMRGHLYNSWGRTPVTQGLLLIWKNYGLWQSSLLCRTPWHICGNYYSFSNYLSMMAPFSCCRGDALSSHTEASWVTATTATVPEVQPTWRPPSSPCLCFPLSCSLVSEPCSLKKWIATSLIFRLVL